MLIERCNRFFDEFEIPVTVFCKKIQLSTPGYYKWKNGQLKLSETTLKRIDNYLKKYGF